jgi:hypothetical protein
MGATLFFLLSPFQIAVGLILSLYYSYFDLKWGRHDEYSGFPCMDYPLTVPSTACLHCPAFVRVNWMGMSKSGGLTFKALLVRTSA